jgi:glycosyltransferase involved in cell wall biosynthesis
MKKICYITTVPGTIESFILKSAEYLHENTDWDISVICSYDEEYVKYFPEYIHYFPVNMRRGISISGIKAMLQMKRIFEAEQFDLIQYSTPNASLYAAIAGKLAKVPVRLYCQWGMAFVGFAGLKRIIFKAVEKLICSLSTWIEPDSKSNLKFAHEQKLYVENKSSVIWNGSACGIDLNKFDVLCKEEYRRKIRKQYNIPVDAFVFGFIGRITRDKGINELFEASRDMIAKYENVYLLMVGDIELDSTVSETLYQWSRENDHVIYVGRTRVVEQYLAAIDCYVLPSYREGFGMSVVEAEAMGVPVIVTNIPGPTNAMIKDETGLIVEKANAQDLAYAMVKIYENPKLSSTFGLAGVTYASTCFEQQQLFSYILEDRKRLLKQ